MAVSGGVRCPGEVDPDPELEPLALVPVVPHLALLLLPALLAQPGGGAVGLGQDRRSPCCQ